MSSQKFHNEIKQITEKYAEQYLDLNKNEMRQKINESLENV